MATTLNKVTVGNDFVLKIKVGLVQYGNNTVSWDYMDLTTCRNIVFNISCTKHNIDINLPFTIDSEDHSVISAIVRAELLHANSIYNFTISGLDSNGYRWTYISPKQQSFLTTAVTEETSAAAYTELAFTAGMIMPLAAQGKDGHTPYIGENNNWWINGVDTGISAIVIPDMSNFYTKTEGINDIRYQLNEIYRDRDCTSDLNKILSHDTISVGSDIHTLWEIVFNATHHQNLGGKYKEQPIAAELIQDETTVTKYTFFDPDTYRQYVVTVEWTTGNEYNGPVLNTSFTYTDFYTKNETDAAISYAIENIDIPGTDLTDYYTKNETDAAISYAIENIETPDLTDYYTKNETDAAISYAIENIETPDLTDYATKSYVTSYVSSAIADIPGTDLTDYATKSYVTSYVSSAIADIPGTDLTDYYTKNETDAAISYAIENIDIPGSGSTTVEQPVYQDYITLGLQYFSGAGWKQLDDNNQPAGTMITDGTIDDYILDTGITMSDDISIEIDYSCIAGVTLMEYSWTYGLMAAHSPNDIQNFVFGLCADGNKGNLHTHIVFNNQGVADLYPWNNEGTDFDQVHNVKINLQGGWVDGENVWTPSESYSFETYMSEQGLSDVTIKLIQPYNRYNVYRLIISKGGTVVADMKPVHTQNGDGLHDSVRNIDIVSPYIRMYSKGMNIFDKQVVTDKINDVINTAGQGYTETRVNQQSPVDCTATINDILADVTNITRWDQVVPLWEVSHNADYHYHGRGRYYDCDIDAYLDKDETTQHNIATYRFWNPVKKNYYTIKIAYDYNDERGNLLSCTYEEDGWWAPLPTLNRSNNVNYGINVMSPVYKVKLYNSIKMGLTGMYFDNYTIQLTNSGLSKDAYGYSPTLTGNDHYITVSFDRTGTTPTASISTSGLSDTTWYDYDENTERLDDYITVTTGEDEIGFYAIIDLTTLPYINGYDDYNSEDNYYKIEGVLFTPTSWGTSDNNVYVSNTIVRGFYSANIVNKNTIDTLNFYIASKY